MQLALLCGGATLPGRAVEPQPLRGHVPAAVAQAQAVDRLPAEQVLRLAIGLPSRDQAGLTGLLLQLYDPASPNYRQWLTPKQFTDRFGPAEADFQAVVDFAQAHGLRVTLRHPNRLVLDVEGAVSDIERAFHIRLQVYPHPTESRTFYAPDSEPVLDLAVPVLHISGLDNYSRPHPNFRTRPWDQVARAMSTTGSGPNGSYRGSDFRAAYVPGVTLSGSGQTVGLLEFDGYYAADITRYETEAGLPNVLLINVPVDGSMPTPGAANVEVCLDIEMALSMAPGLSAIYVYEGSSSTSWVDMLSRMANDNLSKQLSCSFAEGFGPDPACETIFQQMAAQGQSFFAASGDLDAGLILFPSDSPNITVVGGTTLTTTGPGGAYVSETVWNLGMQGGFPEGTAGGISAYYAIPPWQQGIGMTANQGSTTMRNVPDVALTADNIYVTSNNGSSDVGGGTSAAAPLWAGLMALINERAAANGRPLVGFLNPAIYALGNGGGYLSAFHDITTGNNTSPFSPTRFYAVPGYDLCTGWGTPAGSGLIEALAGPPAAPRFQLANRSGTNFNLAWSAMSGSRYQLQYKNSLNDSLWQSLGTPIMAGGSTVTTSDPLTNSQRFYRVILLP